MQENTRSSQAQDGLKRSLWLLWVVVVVVALLAMVSLAVNVVLVYQLLAIRSEAAAVLTDASRALDNLAWQGISFNFPISQTIAFEGDVPFKQDMTVPFKSNVPINTTVNIPIDLGPLGTQTIKVPVNTTVPVNVMVPVQIDQTFHVKTHIPVNVVVPIRLGPNDAPLKDLLTQARDWLARIRKYF